MKRLTLLTAAVLLAAGAHAQTPPSSPMPPSAGTNPTMPAEVTPGSTSAQPAAPEATAAQELKNERQAASTEMKRLSREGAQAQRDAARVGGEMSTPQQDRGGYSGLGDESPLPMR